MWSSCCSLLATCSKRTKTSEAWSSPWRHLLARVSDTSAELTTGMGSCLPRLGLSSAQLDAILNRADTDTAYEAFVALKASKELEKANPGMPLGTVRKRGESTGTNTGAFGAPSNAPKRKRSSEEPGSDYSSPKPMSQNGNAVPSLQQWDFLFPDPELSSVAGPGPSVGWGQSGMNAGGSVMRPYADVDAEGSPDQERQRSLRNAVAHMTSGAMPNSPSMILTASNNMTPAQLEERKRLQEELRQSMQGEDATERKTEALQLITYHLNK